MEDIWFIPVSVLYDMEDIGYDQLRVVNIDQADQRRRWQWQRTAIKQEDIRFGQLRVIRQCYIDRADRVIMIKDEDGNGVFSWKTLDLSN